MSNLRTGAAGRRHGGSPPSFRVEQCGRSRPVSPRNFEPAVDRLGLIGRKMARRASKNAAWSSYLPE